MMESVLWRGRGGLGLPRGVRVRDLPRRTLTLGDTVVLPSETVY